MQLGYWETIFVDSMARTLFVCAYADLQDDLRELNRDYVSPGHGGDWFDLAPETPPHARDYALILYGRLGFSLPVVITNAAWSDILDRHNLTNVPYRWQRPDLESEVENLITDEYITEFGHCMAMMSLGHGVSWFDNHARLDLPRVHFEYSLEVPEDTEDTEDTSEDE